MISFKARENDIVDNQLELQQSVINNLSAFFDGFAKKLQYELRFATSITTQDGTTQRGTSLRVQTGAYKDGTPKFKTVVNKFAVLDIYITLPGQSKKKLTRLVLAPVNILNYNPTSEELRLISSSVGSIITSGILQIAAPAVSVVPEVPAQQPPKPQAPAPAPAPPATPSPAPAPQIIPAGFEILPRGWQLRDVQTGAQVGIADGKTAYKKWTYVDDGRGGKISQGLTWDSVPKTNSVVGSVAQVKLGADAATLFAWYSAQEKTLPTVTERSVIYQNFGLGPKETYAGTAEQNTALLAKLKA